MIVYGQLTQKSIRDLNNAFQKWCSETKQDFAPQFAVIASVGVSSGKVKMKILDVDEFRKINSFIRETLCVGAGK